MPRVRRVRELEFLVRVSLAKERQARVTSSRYRVGVRVGCTGVIASQTITRKRAFRSTVFCCVFCRVRRRFRRELFSKFSYTIVRVYERASRELCILIPLASYVRSLAPRVRVVIPAVVDEFHISSPLSGRRPVRFEDGDSEDDDDSVREKKKGTIR